MRPGCSASSSRNDSATASGLWFGSITPPEPTRILRVDEATRSISTAGVELARLGVLWCSANQNRTQPRASARRASSTVAASASAALPPGGTGVRSSTDSGTGPEVALTRRAARRLSAR
jgi:hypothetical protein